MVLPPSPQKGLFVEAITRALPFLRRYARAVTGSQERGDEWVRLCAEEAEARGAPAAGFPETKLGVFALFHHLQRPFDEGKASAESIPTRLKESLTEMPLLQRQVLLLTVLEGFTVSDAAYVLGIGEDDADSALKKARIELQRVASVRVLVIEDEAVLALDVADIVRNAGHEVVGIAATERAALELAEKHRPHLILADIQLRGADSGISAVRKILQKMQVPVIFVTGFPERLLTGVQLEPAFVISKPFDPDLLRAAIAQALDTVSI
jgi:CheY-like chemotaxis protein